MEKQFQEVFPDLRIEGGMAELLDTVEVSRVSINKKKDLLRIYVVSHQWIHKKYIYQLERQIEEQLFSNVPLRVKIIERFYLSRQYTPENFLEVYRPSILLELKNHSVFLNHLFSTAEITFPETNKMHLVLVDSVVAKEREEELVHILEKIFCERCGFDLIVETEMRKPEGESRAMRNSELRIREEVRHVLAHTHYGEMLGEKEQNRMEEQAEAAGEQPKAAAAAKDGEAKKEKAADGGRGKGFSGGGRGSFKKGKGSFGRNADNQPRKSSNPDVLYGRDFEDESVEILKIGDEIGDVVIRGRVQSVDMREIRNERTIFMFTITDFTDTIGVKIFVQNAEVPELKDAIKKGAFIKVKGKTTVDAFDHDLTVMSVWGIKKITDFRTGRQDTSPVKRVELHCHTKMSDMDGVTDAARLVQRAYEWGHPAIAITDHGVVQSFPEANHAIEAIDGAYRKKYQAEHPDATKDELKKVSAPFKVIYGMEAYLVDDLKDIVVNSKGQDIHGNYVVFDIETTGFSPVVNKIIEIGAVRVENGAIVDKFSTFVNPKVPIPFRIENLTGINDNMVLDAPDIETVLPKFLEFSEGAVMVAHNASFDMSFIEHNCVLQGIEREFTTADTVAMARFLLPGLNRFKLDTVAKAVGVSLENHHRAVDDAGCTAEIFVKFVKMLEERNILTLDDLNAQGKVSEEAVRKLPSYHAIILAKNETGRVNLYRLVSESHLKYYNRRPKLPKSVYLKYQDGLMIGSACEAGELYQAILRGEPDAAIARLVDFYDYLEIQPIGNNAFMIKKEDVSAVESEEDLKEINRRIVKLGEQFHKPVVATCDVHFMDPQDEIYRRIIMTGKGFDDADEQAPLFLRTTEEMLEEFSYLGSEKAEEVVITNPRKISDLVEKISPIRAGKFPPVIEDSDKTLRRICYDRAHEIYGEELPEIVSARLERELNSIISNGYAVMYIIAQKLVWKSNEDGYLVGSRGSVGSSFVATMAGITEVNPLSPHYYCESCHYSEFDSPRVKEYVGRAGCDMPDAVCPNCGKPLKKAGFDIPFETFLGFKGNKEPDIDLNFSGDYQSKAHKYTEVIFGAGQTFRAGTIGTLADKTAFGYVKNYYEVDFYDYLEIQPIGNNAFMIKKEDVSAVESEEDLKEINRRIVKLGEQFHKPVVATCDVHFMDPQDEIYRRIIMTGKGFDDADEQAPLFLRTTEEMLEEFSYLGSEKAEEVVITNPRKISDLVEKISPIRAGKFPPVIEDSDKTLRRICYDRAHEIYGEELPEIVSARLERELNSIISNGYAVMYIIAQKLVWKSNEDGYLVGSRGSVGSSFVATMAGITEVNPLSPHYYCESCHYSEFDSPRVKEYVGRAGCDMPDAVCPNCGKPLKKAGFDIPFETFLGFKGNKEPDIDLNFSGDYQSKAHKYTEVIFGAGQTFRAGTIGTLADKTAFGYVKNYYEERGQHKRNCEIDRIVEGCTGIRRTTGQHPGGIIVLPFGEDINSFTPVQHPANDMTTDIITTHFDYHSIDANLLKLDILGHDDPTMIRMLEDITHLDAQTIPLDNPEVMSLFKSTEALGIKPEDIGGCPLGCLGVPEFGTDFVIQMLLDTKPQSFSDLIRISGLSHGTDVWLGNAQTLIEEGKATISTAICTRDDIMIYLIDKGLESELSFTIMESVRKGKGLKPEWEEEMKAHDVPDWYIWSCKKIKYMFPKAHAAAYVMMAYRIAYYKIFYPLAYYAAYFSIRASAFSYELMCMGRDRLEYYMKDYEKRKDTLTQKEQATVKDMKIVQEMYARGFDFVPVDLYKAQAHRFQVYDDKHLMPALDSIEGLGDKAADAVVLAARNGKFLSKDDFRDRTKVSKTIIDFMADLGVFGDLPESNQFSLFDY